MSVEQIGSRDIGQRLGDLQFMGGEVARALADVAAAYLLNAHARNEASEVADMLRHGALHDPLTGLPNRRLLEERLQHAGQRAQRTRTSAAVLFADLDRFKAVNDSYGHQTGDELLCAVGHRLSGLVRPGDTLARVSGDEFVFLCEDLHDATDADMLARRINDSFREPFVLGALELSITASIGVAFAGAGAEISSNLVRDADTAMYRAKRSANRQTIDLTSAGLHATHGLESELRLAHARDELTLVFQPIVRTADGAMTGVEALLRWHHPTRGAVAPMAMIEAAERVGFIHQLGAWVLEQSCRDHATWIADQPHQPIDLAVNVSGRQVMRPGFVDTVSDIVSRTGMNPANLILEITESVFIEDTDRAFAALSGLRDLGVRLALDDFGTGYSSLSYLQRLPLDIVKIDQTFTAGLGLHHAGAAIVTAIISMAHSLGLTVTAEGVETPLQNSKLRWLGCDHAQGFHYAPGLPSADIAARRSVASPGPFQRAARPTRTVWRPPRHPSTAL